MFSFLRSLWYRLRSMLRRERVSAEFAEELRFHRDQLVDEAVRAGSDPAEAARLAAVRLGNDTVLTERARAWWSLGWIESAAQDVRYAARFLVRSPAFTAVAVLSIALGVGANAAVFSVVDRVFFRAPEGVVDVGSLRRLYLRHDGGGNPSYVRASFSFAEYFAIDSGMRSVSGIAAYQYPSAVRLGTDPDAPRVKLSFVTHAYFTVLGVRPHRGRLLMPDDDVPVGEMPVVLSNALWQRQFAGATDIVGKRLTISDRPYVVVGVTPEGFKGVEVEAAELWAPAIPMMEQDGGRNWRTQRNGMSLAVIARLRDDISDAPLRHEMRRGVDALPPASFLSPGQTLTPLTGPLLRARGPAVRDAGITIATRLAAAAILVLLAACANVANLLIARALSRRRELAVRLAVGVGRARLMGQMLAETLLLCGAGGVVAVVIAQRGGRLLRTLLFPSVTWIDQPVDGRILAFTAAVTLAAGLVASLVPTWRATVVDLSHALRTGMSDRSGGGARRGRAALLTLQVAFSFVLLAGAGLFTRSLVQAMRFDAGFDAAHAVMVRVGASRAAGQRADMAAILDEAAARVRGLPGVRVAGATASLPYYSISFERLSIPGRDIATILRESEPFYVRISAPAMQALGVRLEEGRLLEPTDRAGAPRVVVVTRSLARALWSDAPAIGQCLRIGADSFPCSTVVGVVRDMMTVRLTDARGALYFTTLEQVPGGAEPWAILARVDGDVDVAKASIRASLRRFRPEVMTVTVESVRDRMDEQMQPWRLGAYVFAAFGVIGLVLAAIGIYGLISFSVTQRMGELGIRAALGATRGRLAALVLGQTLRLTMVGLLLGAAVALAVSRSLGGLLFQTSERDPLVLVATIALLSAAAVLAALAPTRRATRVDPAAALRIE